MGNRGSCNIPSMSDGLLLLNSLAGLSGNKLVRALRKLGDDEMLVLLAELAPTIPSARSVWEDKLVLRRTVLELALARGMTKAELSRAAAVSSSAIKYQVGAAVRQG